MAKTDCNFFLLSNYRNIEYCIGEFKKLSDIGTRLNLLDYQKKLLVAHLCQI
jgi:hypothetical protein